MGCVTCHGGDGMTDDKETARIEPSTLDRTKDSLRKASESLDAGEFGNPDVPPEGGLPERLVDARATAVRTGGHVRFGRKLTWANRPGPR